MSTGVVRLLGAGLLCAVCLGLSGCIVVSENSAHPHVPTVGKELRDLKLARDEGAIAPDEYDQARQNLLKRLDKPVKS